jgi:hypothetical protein
MGAALAQNAQEVRNRALSIRRALRWQPIITALAIGGWTLVSGLAVAGFSVWKFQGEQDDSARTRTLTEQQNALTRKLEAQRPFLEQRLKLYFETATVTGRLVHPTDLPTDGEIWTTNTTRFWQLRWGELEAAGDAGTRNAARLVGRHIRAAEANPTADRKDLRWAIECLADELRLSLEHSWGFQPGLTRLTVEGFAVSKLPQGCTASGEEPRRPLGMSAGKP